MQVVLVCVLDVFVRVRFEAIGGGGREVGIGGERGRGGPGRGKKSRGQHDADAGTGNARGWVPTCLRIVRLVPKVISFVETES